MKRRERLRGTRLLVVVSALAFALGVLFDAGLTWRLHLGGETRGAKGAEFEGSLTTTAAEPVHDTIEAPVERPGEDGSPAPTGTTGAAANESAIGRLRDEALTIPVEGVRRSALRDTFSETRGSNRAHEAIDIMAPRRTPVVGAQDGTIVKLFTSKAGGLTIYQFDTSQTFCYYYAHLDGYADGLQEGSRVRKGQLLGYVGSTGNASADAPHLHFAIFRLTPERQWWKGEPINPYPVLKSE
jgi:peptidoglycan LD-endopeptidase LytH